VPPLPKQLQGQGFHSLSDPKTWNILVKDRAGTVMATIPAHEARSAFTGTKLEEKLPHKVTVDVAPSKFSHENIVLDGSKAPKEDVTEQERLAILKEFTGIL
jgi:hypothetical protein